MTASQLSMLISLMTNGAGWLAQEIAIARQQGTISDEDFDRLLNEAKASDKRVREKYERIQTHLKTDASGNEGGD